MLVRSGIVLTKYWYSVKKMKRLSQRRITDGSAYFSIWNLFGCRHYETLDIVCWTDFAPEPPGPNSPTTIPAVV